MASLERDAFFLPSAGELAAAEWTSYATAIAATGTVRAALIAVSNGRNMIAEDTRKHYSMTEKQPMPLAHQTTEPEHPTLYEKWFARSYDTLMARAERKALYACRQKLITPLEGRILEVGCGTGVNFPLYGSRAHVLAIDPSAAMLEQAQQRIDQEAPAAHITLLQASTEDTQLKKAVAGQSLDAVVAMLVLCTVQSPETAIARFAHWLKPGGRLVVLEHIRSHRRIGALVQTAVTPLWKVLGRGCRLDRPSDALIISGPFAAVEQTYFTHGLPFYCAVFVRKDESTQPSV